MLWKTLKLTAAITLIPLALAGCHSFSKSSVEKGGFQEVPSVTVSSSEASSEALSKSDMPPSEPGTGNAVDSIAAMPGLPVASSESSAITGVSSEAARAHSEAASTHSEAASNPASSSSATPTPGADALSSDASESRSGEIPLQSSQATAPVSFQLSDTAPSSESPDNAATPTSVVQQTSSTEESLLTSAAKRTVDLVRSAIPLPGELERNRLAKEISEFEKFDFAFELPTVAGEQVSSKSFGGQLFVIDIWATWCGPCKRGIPELIELQKEYESHGIQVIGITCDSPDGEDSQEVARRAYNIGEQLKVNYPLLVDNGTTIPQIPGFRSYPTTLFMTPDGRVRYIVSGLQSKAKLEMMIKTLLEL